MLQIENLQITFTKEGKKHKAVHGVSLDIQPGEIVGLVGGSGSGKSITAQAVLRLIPENDAEICGSIYFEGEDLLKKKQNSMNKIRGNRIGMVFQNPMSSLNPTRKIGAQIMEGIIEHKTISTREAYLLSIEWLGRLGLSEPECRMEQYPFQLSGGMCQRVMIAIALSCNPTLLIADEPTTALDAILRMQIVDIFRQARNQFGISIFFITHDLGIVAGLCDRIAIIHQGTIVESGPVDDIFYSPKHSHTQMLLNAQKYLYE